MGRIILSVSLILLAAASIMAGRVHRYQYFSVVGPSWDSKTGEETDFRRIDRWTGTPQVWVCDDVDTTQAANVPPPPIEPPDLGSAAATPDAALRNGGYLIALKAWRVSYPHVNPQTMRVTQPRCRWEVAR